MNIKIASLLVLAGIVYTFLLKTIQTIFPDSTSYPTAAAMTHMVAVLSMFMIAIFCYYFLRLIRSSELIGLKWAALTVVLIVSVNTFFRLSAMCANNPLCAYKLFYAFPNYLNFLKSGDYRNLMHLMVWLSSASLCWFFLALFRAVDNKFVAFRKTAFLVSVAAVILLVIRTGGEIVWLFGPESELLKNLPFVIQGILFLIYMIAMAVTAKLFWEIYRQTDMAPVLGIQNTPKK